MFTCGTLYNAKKYKNVKADVSNIYKEIPADTNEIHTFTTTGKNVYIFMSDMMNGNYMGRILEENPELNEKLSGFTWYRDCLSKASDTQTSMMSLYGGNDYSLIEFNKKNITTHEHIQSSIDQFCIPFINNQWNVTFAMSSSLFEPSEIVKTSKNTRIFLDDDYSDYFAKLNSIENKNNGKTFLLQVLPVFQMLPHSIKKYLYQEGVWNSPYLQINERQRRACESSSHIELIPEFVNFTEDKTNQVKFFTSSITHSPWAYNENGQIISSVSDLEIPSEDLAYYSSKRAVILLAELVKKLKDNNAYDNTIIIFVSDHGNQLEDLELCKENIQGLTDNDYHYHLSMSNTILLIKGLNETGNIKISNAQVQNSDIYDYIHEHVFNDSKKFSEYLNYTDDTPRKRTYSVDLYQKNDYSSIKEVPCINFAVEGSMFTPASWSMYKE